MDISIIIPIYNVENYLVECLESVKKNVELLKIEVFLIDDGSTDGSSDIARFYAESIEAFKYYRIENSGPGRVRNFGVTLASGKYLYFMDADDILTEGALYKMFCMAEKNQTDLTVCNVGRIQGKKLTISGLHSRIFYNLKGNIAHIKNHPNFVYDTISCDKLILRSFYIKKGISYPEDFLYEDIPVTMKLHYCANSVSVIRSIGYFWRIRTEGEKQLTRILDKKALSDKIEMLTRTINYIYKNIKEPEILEAFQIKILDVDFEVFFDKLYLMDSKDAREVIHLLASFIDQYVDKELISKIPLKKQQIIQDVLNEDLDHLIQVVNYKNSNYSKAPIEETNNGLEMVLPKKIFTINNRGISNEFLNTPPNGFIDYVNAEDAKISIFGHLYFWRINVPIEQDQKVKARLLNEETGITVPLETLPFQCPSLTEERGTLLNYDDYKFYNYNYNWAGFQINLDFDELAQTDGLQGTNFILLSFENRICKGEILVRGIKKAAKEVCDDFSYAGGRFGGRIVFDQLDIININIVPIDDCKKTVKKVPARTVPKETLIIKTMKETKKNLFDLEKKLEEGEKSRKVLKAKLDEESENVNTLKDKLAQEVKNGAGLREQLEREIKNGAGLREQLEREVKSGADLKEKLDSEIKNGADLQDRLNKEIRTYLGVAKELNSKENENKQLQIKLIELDKDKKEITKQKLRLEEEKQILNKKIRLIEHKYESIQKSLSFKFGRILTFIPRKIRDALK